MIGYIYKTTDLLTGLIYIGQKKSDEFLGNKYIGSGKAFKRVVKQYSERGIDKKTAFKVELLEECFSEEELDQRERYWIEKLDSRNEKVGYNVLPGGEGGAWFKGCKHSEETKAKMSEDRKGEKNANYGNRWTQSDELKALHSVLSSGENNGMYGKHFSEESKEKMRKSASGKLCYSNLELDLVTYIHPEEVEEYESKGWFRGNIHKTKKYN